MLVLTRKSEEKIRIGDDIVITVLRTKGKAVRLGIEAPNHMRVLRGEIAFEGGDADESHTVEETTPAKAMQARVPRSQVAAVLPALAAGTGPLADFINTASVVVR